jgi:HD superfamily phosphohydrolase YqeK
MHNDLLIRLKTWFAAYTRSFLTDEATADSPFVLKIDHTARVCENICLLGRSIHLTDGRMRIAEAIGLLHDVGRFVQYRRYRTFNDRHSANHAVLGIHVLEADAVLDDLAADDKIMIIDAVRFHNAPALPRNRSPEATVFMKLIRDADKLDIWKVFADFFRFDQRPEKAIVQDLPDDPGWSEAMVEAIVAKRPADFQDMKTLNDFRLLQLSWVFDLNFTETCVQARKRGDLAAIAGLLPDDRAVHHAVAGVMNQLDEQRLRNVPPEGGTS